jgi:predicted hotdog family 3-hydroxylacyl-ACP dehydratase
VVELFANPFARVAISLAAVFGLAVAGQALAAWAGTRLRQGITSAGGRRVEELPPRELLSLARGL